MATGVDFDPDEREVLDFLGSARLFRNIEPGDVRALAGHVLKLRYAAGEEVFCHGDSSECLFIIAEGKFSFERHGHITMVFSPGDTVGESAFFDRKPRAGAVKAMTDGAVFMLPFGILEKKDIIHSDSMVALCREMTAQMTSYLRQEDALFEHIDVLLIEDGGCAPGKNPIIAFLTEYLEKAGRKVFITAEGYRSLVNGRDEDFRCLIYDPKVYESLDHIPGVIFAPPLRDARGSNFRSERYPEFREEELQMKAAATVVARGVKVVVGLGGNGTFAGMRALASHLPPHIQVFFIPLTIDSDVHGTECIGQHTGVEVGAEKIRCYMADARTHHRCYIIEMMGAMGGFHALHSCIGAGAHLAVLPTSSYDVEKVARALEEKESAVVVVAEGYRREERKAKGYKGNAAEYFRDELAAARLDARMRVICEPFSRDIRGASPNNLDIALVQKMARKVALLMKEGKSHIMPAVLADNEGEIPFDEIRTDNTKGQMLAALANRLFEQ